METKNSILVHALDKLAKLSDTRAALNHVVCKCDPIMDLWDFLASGTLEDPHDRVSLSHRNVLDKSDFHVLVV